MIVDLFDLNNYFELNLNIGFHLMKLRFFLHFGEADNLYQNFDLFCYDKIFFLYLKILLGGGVGNKLL